MQPATVPGARSGASEFLVVGVADLQASTAPDARIVTYALGSCIAVTLFDPVAKIGGMLHFMLPRPSTETDGELNPCLYASSGVPLLLRQLGVLGAERARLVGCAVGAAEILDDGGLWAIGQRNQAALRELIHEERLFVAAEDLGGHDVRNVMLDVGSGTVVVRVRAQERVLWQSR